MAVEIPFDLITELQISLRKEAGLSCYHPNDASLPDFPSVEDAISDLDPSPAYLRCRHCKGRLLRGVNSTICVFCGRQQNKDVPPQPIKFMSTFGSRWFLKSLDLDGSELVSPLIEANESNSGQNTQQNEFPLSDLLDLEIRWPSESERLETSVSDKTPAQKLSTLNLAGVDLDNFFVESKGYNSTSAQSGGQFAQNKQNDDMGNSALYSHENLSLFENINLSEKVATSKGVESDDPSSGWDAEFQSADSGTQRQESKSFDPFVGSSSVDPPAHMDSVFGPGKDLFDGKTKENTTSASSMNDWFKGDIWSNSNTGVTAQDEQFKLPVNDKLGDTAVNTNSSSSMNMDWVQDNRWHTTSSSQATNNKTIDKDDDSFDTWNDFTSSANAQAPSSNSSTQSVSHKVPSVEQASKINLFGNNPQDDVDGFSQPDVFTGTFNNQNGSKKDDFMQPEASVSDWMASLDASDGGRAEEIETGLDVANANTKSRADDVEVLMSQMHDLSFMLESNLSLPQKKDPFDSFSKD